jgi:hypothetical protein
MGRMSGTGGDGDGRIAEELNGLVQLEDRAEAVKEWRYIIKMSLESTEKTLDELSEGGWVIFSVMPTAGANYAIAAYREKKLRLTR